MPKKDNSSGKKQELEARVLNLQQHLDILDQRLDNIDSVVTAVTERIMSQPITLNITCPNCGKNIEIAIIGNKRPTT
ncbi:MAG: hypothetical protein QGF23_01545 [Dehalococcoidales bacterium]|nr:hypothetical protein [Dehalococcoidales bacterium]